MDLKTLKDIPPWDWPEGTAEISSKTLRDNQASASDRLVAAELAGDFTVINDALAETLLSILRSGDESAELRAQAAISLGPVLDHADIDGFEDPEDVPITEQTFHRIQESLRSLYADAGVPKEVRRSILEAAVRAPQDWHPGAIRAAYASDDEAWRLTAVFCMRFVRGFDAQILEALGSDNPDIRYEAICAAGNWEVDAAWPHIAALVTSGDTDKPLLLAAIEAVGEIRPQEADEVLADLIDSDDEDIAEAACEALALAGGLPDDEGRGRRVPPLRATRGRGRPMAKNKKPNHKMQVWIDARTRHASLTLKSSGSGAGHESRKARQAGQPQTGTVEDATWELHRAPLPQAIRQALPRRCHVDRGTIPSRGGEESSTRTAKQHLAQEIP